MLHPVWSCLNFWYIFGVFSSVSWFYSALHMEFMKKGTGSVTVFWGLAISISWSIANFVFSKLYLQLKLDPEAIRFFRGYERVGKTTGYTLLFFGNVGLYYYSEKSIACMMTFFFLAVHCLCALLCIQPYTDFGALEFLLSASLNQALSLFGFHLYPWLVIIVCIGVAGVRYCLEPVDPPKGARSSDTIGGKVGRARDPTAKYTFVGLNCSSVLAIRRILSQLTIEQVNWTPWIDMQWPEDVGNTFQINGQRILFEGPFGHEWYLGERFVQQSLGSSLDDSSSSS
ncbi:uncharacterized protein LOC130792196 [Actinidia eriantha]|uniref:uncharacterized protein LOC130792196 n=1 Tax=Actinidia eriantha TaxID=165200 RepID=UPI00258EDD93|nr:uncharacterized protein LOC130792196 [Actinidia eriantha]